MAYVSRIGLFNVLRTVFLTSCKRFKIVVNGHIFCKTSERAQHNVPFWTSLIWKPCLSHRCCFSLYIMCCVYLSWDWYNGHTKSSAPLSNLVQNCILRPSRIGTKTVQEFFLVSYIIPRIINTKYIIIELRNQSDQNTCFFYRHYNKMFN